MGSSLGRPSFPQHLRRERPATGAIVKFCPRCLLLEGEATWRSAAVLGRDDLNRRASKRHWDEQAWHPTPGLCPDTSPRQVSLSHCSLAVF